MHRNKLIQQVKDEYALLASRSIREDFIDENSRLSAEAYFERLIEQIIAAIQAGRFDRFMNGRQVMEAVANDRQRWGIFPQ